MLLSKDERIEEYQAKCNSYETELKRVNTENEKYLNEILDMTNENEATTKKLVKQEVLRYSLTYISFVTTLRIFVLFMNSCFVTVVK